MRTPDAARSPRRQTARLLAVLAAGTVAAAGCTGQGAPTTAESSTAGTVYPRLTLPYEYAMGATAPDLYQVTYYSGMLTLRQSPLIAIVFRYDTGRPDENTELLAAHGRIDETNQWTITPVTIHGLDGFASRSQSKGATWLDYSLTKGPLTITVTADLGGNATDTAAEEWTTTIAESLRVDSGKLTGAWPGSVADPGVPFTYTMPRALAVPEQQRAKVTTYSVDLFWRNAATRFAFYQYDSIEKAANEYTTLSEQTKAAYVPTEHLKTARTSRDNIGRSVDEGYLFRAGPTDRPQALGMIFRKGQILVKLLTTVPQGADPDDPRIAAALDAPTDITRLWQWRRL